MRTVLMISPFFVPRRRVGALRAFKFAIHLKEFGYQPFVLCLKDKQGRLTQRERELLDGITVRSITPLFDKTTQTVKTKNRPANKRNGLSGLLAAWVDKHTPVDTWIYQFLLAWPSIIRFARECKPDIIWATGDPWSSLWLGRIIAKKLKIPFVADFRDPWVPGEISLRRRSRFSAGLDQKAERKIVNDASGLVFTSQNTERVYAGYYKLKPGSTMTIYNSFSRSLTAGNVLPEAASYQNRDKFVLLFYGRFRTLSPVGPLIRTIQELSERQGTELAGRLEIHCFGQPDTHQMQEIEQSGLRHQFRIREPIPPEESLGVLNQADLLLLTTHSSRKLVIPAKLWDYLYSDSPVLSIAPNPEIGHILRQVKKGFHFGPGQIGQAAEYLAERIKIKMEWDENSESDYENGAGRSRYESKETTRQLAGLFDDLLTGRDAE